MKKGQASIFVIVAILIIVVIIILFFAKSQIQDSSHSPEITPIYNSVENCVQETGMKGLTYIGERGGYYDVPVNSIELNSTKATVYFDKGISDVPDRNKVSGELSKYIQTNLKSCTKNFSAFSEFKVTETSPTATINIEDLKIVINVLYPLSIAKGDRTFQIKNFNGIELPVRLGQIIDFSQEYIKQQSVKDDYICISCLNNLSKKYDLNISLFDYDSETTIYFIVDENTTINNDPYYFIFANKFKEIEQ